MFIKKGQVEKYIPLYFWWALHVQQVSKGSGASSGKAPELRKHASHQAKSGTAVWKMENCLFLAPSCILQNGGFLRWTVWMDSRSLEITIEGTSNVVISMGWLTRDPKYLEELSFLISSRSHVLLAQHILQLCNTFLPFFFSSSLDSPLLDFPFPKHSVLTPTWLLGKSSAGPCKPSFLTFLNWGSELNSLSICPGVLSSERSNWNTFLTSSQGDPTRGQMSRQGRRPSPSVASHHHLGAEYMLLSSSPSSFPSVLYTSDETKENEQTRIQHNNFILIQIQPCRLQLWPSFYRIIKCNFHHSSSPFPRG